MATFQTSIPGFAFGTAVSDLTSVQRHYIQHMIGQSDMESVSAFSGLESDKNCAYEWLKEAEEHLYSLFVQPELWVILSSVRFRDDAQKWFLEVAESFLFGEWKVFKTAFLNKWYPGYFYTVVSEYQAVEQEEGESIEEFHKRFMHLRSKLPESDADIFAKVLFINGLKGGTKEVVEKQYPETLADAFMTAKVVESLKIVKDESATTSNTSTSNTTTSNTTNTTPTSTTIPRGPMAHMAQAETMAQDETIDTETIPQPVTCFSCGNIGHTKQICPYKQAKRERQVQCKKCNQVGHSMKWCNSDFGLTFRGNEAVVKCYRCKQGGHYARDCNAVLTIKEKGKEVAKNEVEKSEVEKTEVVEDSKEGTDTTTTTETPETVENAGTEDTPENTVEEKDKEVVDWAEDAETEVVEAETTETTSVSTPDASTPAASTSVSAIDSDVAAIIETVHPTINFGRPQHFQTPNYTPTKQKAKKTIQCFRCGDMGHKAADCHIPLMRQP